MKIPTKTVEFLDALKVAQGWPSDYRVAKAMGWSHQTVTSYRTGRSCMSAANAIRVADAIGLPRGYVLACMEAERENNAEVAHVWRDLAHQLRGVAASVLLALLLGVMCLLGLAKPAKAEVFASATAIAAVPASSHSPYYVKLLVLAA